MLRQVFWILHTSFTDVEEWPSPHWHWKRQCSALMVCRVCHFSYLDDSLSFLSRDHVRFGGFCSVNNLRQHVFGIHWGMWVFSHACPWNSAIWLLEPNVGNSPPTLGDVYHLVLIDDLSPCLGFTYSDEDGRRSYKRLHPSLGPLPTLCSRNVADWMDSK